MITSRRSLLTGVAARDIQFMGYARMKQEGKPTYFDIQGYDEYGYPKTETIRTVVSDNGALNVSTNSFRHIRSISVRAHYDDPVKPLFWIKRA